MIKSLLFQRKGRKRGGGMCCWNSSSKNYEYNPIKCISFLLLLGFSCTASCHALTFVPILNRHPHHHQLHPFASNEVISSAMTMSARRLVQQGRRGTILFLNRRSSRYVDEDNNDKNGNYNDEEEGEDGYYDMESQIAKRRRMMMMQQPQRKESSSSSSRNNKNNNERNYDNNVNQRFDFRIPTKEEQQLKNMKYETDDEDDEDDDDDDEDYYDEDYYNDNQDKEDTVQQSGNFWSNPKQGMDGYGNTRRRRRRPTPRRNSISYSDKSENDENDSNYNNNNMNNIRSNKNNNNKREDNEIYQDYSRKRTSQRYVMNNE